MATYLESTAVKLCQDLLHLITMALVGTDTRSLLDVLEGCFGVREAAKADDDNEEVEIIEEEEDLLAEGLLTCIGSSCF